METNIPFIPDDDPNRNRLQLTMIDLEQHKEWISSKTGGIDSMDIIFIMSNHKPSSIILPMLRRHKNILMWVCVLAEMLWLYGWVLWSSKL